MPTVVCPACDTETLYPSSFTGNLSCPACGETIPVAPPVHQRPQVEMGPDADPFDFDSDRPIISEPDKSPPSLLPVVVLVFGTLAITLVILIVVLLVKKPDENEQPQPVAEGPAERKKEVHPPAPAPKAPAPLPVRPAPAPKAPAPLPTVETPAAQEDKQTHKDKVRFKRRDESSDEELRKQLQRVPEVGFDQAGAAFVLKSLQQLTTTSVVAPPPDIGPRLYKELSQQLKRPDFDSLPWLRVAESQVGKETAEGLQVYSVNLRTCMQQAVSPMDLSPDVDKLKDLMFTEHQSGSKPLQWNKPECVPTLAQMLQTENTSLRTMLIEFLGEIEGKQASVVLAQRAIFDLAPQVRQKAVETLAARPRKEFQHIFLASLRWPWRPVADHAAEAIVALRMKEVSRELVALLDEPDPTLPFIKETKGGKVTYVNEIVRVNHMSNCLLCHAPSMSKDDLVRGHIPIPGQEMPQLYSGGTTGQFVRADTTFLRQDFSLVQPVANPGTWPGQQRFDYLLRQRRATAKEINLLQTLTKDKKADDTYPQRDAVLFALREVNGRDAGSRAEDWLPLLVVKNPERKDTRVPDPGQLPNPPPETSESVRLARELVQSGPAQQERNLSQLREGKGVVYTEALALAIPQLDGDSRGKARQTLAERLTRLREQSLGNYLKDEDVEIRRAAALACAMKGAKALVPNLIPLLGDQEGLVKRAAQQALRELTGQSFDNQQAWQDWWNKQNR